VGQENFKFQLMKPFITCYPLYVLEGIGVIWENNIKMDLRKIGRGDELDSSGSGY